MKKPPAYVAALEQRIERLEAELSALKSGADIRLGQKVRIVVHPDATVSFAPLIREENSSDFYRVKGTSGSGSSRLLLDRAEAADLLARGRIQLARNPSEVMVPVLGEEGR